MYANQPTAQYYKKCLITGPKKCYNNDNGSYGNNGVQHTGHDEDPSKLKFIRRDGIVIFCQGCFDSLRNKAPNNRANLERWKYEIDELIDIGELNPQK
jgi:hypothetical protein